MADGRKFILPDAGRHVDGSRRNLWIRRALLALVLAVPIVALLNVVGQRPRTLRAAAPAASLEVRAPTRVRGGLIFEARFVVRSRREIRRARLVLDPGWLEGMTLNTTAPDPVSETSRDGKLVLELGRLAPGRSHRLFLQFQTNPTTVGAHDQDVELADGELPLLRLRRSITVLP